MSNTTVRPNPVMIAVVDGVEIARGTMPEFSKVLSSYAKEHGVSVSIMDEQTFKNLPAKLAAQAERKAITTINSEFYVACKTAGDKAYSKMHALVLGSAVNASTMDDVKKAVKHLGTLSAYNHSDVLAKAKADAPLSKAQIAWLLSESARQTAIARVQRKLGPAHAAQLEAVKLPF